MGEIGTARTVSTADDDIIDLVFSLRGQAIALDYAARLWQELVAAAPALAGIGGLGVHPLAGVSPGDTETYFTRRARLALRMPAGSVAAAANLAGLSLDIGGRFEIQPEPAIRRLQPAKVLYSYCVTLGDVDEGRFLSACHERLTALGITAELIVGRAQTASAGGRDWNGHSLMIHQIKPEQSLLIQREGLGGERRHGWGIFVPHKSLAAVDE